MTTGTKVQVKDSAKNHAGRKGVIVSVKGQRVTCHAEYDSRFTFTVNASDIETV